MKSIKIGKFRSDLKTCVYTPEPPSNAIKILTGEGFQVQVDEFKFMYIRYKDNEGNWKYYIIDYETGMSATRFYNNSRVSTFQNLIDNLNRISEFKVLYENYLKAKEKVIKEDMKPNNIKLPVNEWLED